MCVVYYNYACAEYSAVDMRKLELILQFKYKFSSVRPLIWRHAIAKGHFRMPLQAAKWTTTYSQRLHGYDNSFNGIVACWIQHTKETKRANHKHRKECLKKKKATKTSRATYFRCEFVYVASDCVYWLVPLLLLFLNICCSPFCSLHFVAWMPSQQNVSMYDFRFTVTP